MTGFVIWKKIYSTFFQEQVQPKQPPLNVLPCGFWMFLEHFSQRDPMMLFSGALTMPIASWYTGRTTCHDKVFSLFQILQVLHPTMQGRKSTSLSCQIPMFLQQYDQYYQYSGQLFPSFPKLLGPKVFSMCLHQAKEP